MQVSAVLSWQSPTWRKKKYRAGGELRKLTWEIAELRLFKCVHVTIWQEVPTAISVLPNSCQIGSLCLKGLLLRIATVKRVWNPNRVQFLDVWTELRGSTGICWFATLQSYDSRESCLPLTKCLHKLQFIVALHWPVVSSTCDQTGSLWAIPSLLCRR